MRFSDLGVNEKVVDNGLFYFRAKYLRNQRKSIFHENFEILGPQGTFETPWDDKEALRTP